MPKGLLPAEHLPTTPPIELPEDDPLRQLEVLEHGIWGKLGPQIDEEIKRSTERLTSGSLTDIDDYRECCGYLAALRWVKEVANDVA